jgi:hypothetical protein
MILKGLSWGLFGVAALIPLYAFSIAWSWLGPILRKSAEDELELLTDVFEEDFEEEPELPSNEEEPPPRYKYIASTIVRPPHVIRREDNEDGDEDGDENGD